MDTELARTFLAVVADGSFLGASQRLNITQSTVSVRIRTLEEDLRCRLFVRNKAGAMLTPAGHSFQKHAQVLLQTIEQARHDVSVTEGFADVISIGARIGLWDGFLARWLGDTRRASPNLSFRSRTGFEEDMIPALVEGRLNIGVMYTPQYRPGLEIEKLFDERLVMVTTRRNAQSEPDANHIFVDWGPEFYSKFRATFPDFAGSALSVSVGWLGLQHLQHYGGSGYFPHRLVRSRLKERTLFAVRGAPEFEMPAYVVSAKAHGTGEIAKLLISLRAAATTAA